MCVAAIAWAADARWKLVVVGNRDEFHARPAAPLARWGDGRIIAGRDLEAGGTWLGVGDGRFGLVTNRRQPGFPKPDLASRGALVSDWLRGHEPQADIVMNPFNLWLADASGLRALSNFPDWHDEPLAGGIHSLSNGAHDDRWFKSARLEAALTDWLDADQPSEALFAALRDETPETADPEDAFSAIFIRNATYGTRCSTVITVDAQGLGRITERSFDPAGGETGTVAIDFRWS